MTARPHTDGHSRVTLLYDGGRLIVIDAEGRRFEGVEPVRCFPISTPQSYVALCDNTGREVACVDDPSTLPPDVQKVLEAEIERREFVPTITRILRASDDAEYCEWDVETDRGCTSFRTLSDESVRRLEDGRAMIVDGSGIRYVIPDPANLDRSSRLILERFI